MRKAMRAVDAGRHRAPRPDRRGRPQTLAASGATSRIEATAGSLLAAGLDAEGRLGRDGRPQVSATEAIGMHGQHFAAADASFSATTLDLSGSLGGARELSLSAHGGQLDASRAELVAEQRLVASTTGTLRTDAAKLSAPELQLQARELSNVGGELVQSGAGELRLDLAGRLDNRDGLLLGAGDVSLRAAGLLNQGGTIGASQGSLRIDSLGQELVNRGGTVAARGELPSRAAGSTTRPAACAPKQR